MGLASTKKGVSASLQPHPKPKDKLVTTYRVQI